MLDILLLNIDPNGGTLLAYILTGVTSIISVLFAAMIQAKNAQIKEKDYTLERVTAAKNESIQSYIKLLADAKKDIETLQAEKVQLLSHVLPPLKATQEILKDMTTALREISKK